jgi:hypothetical protein
VIRCHVPRGIARAWPGLTSASRALPSSSSPDAAGDQVQQLVGVWVQLPVVYRRSAKRGRPDRVAVDAPRAAAASLHEHGATRLPLPPNYPAGQLERLSDRYLSGRPHRCLLRRPVHYLSFPPGGALVPGPAAVM